MDSKQKHRLAWVALFFCVVAIVVFRAPEMVFAPSLLFDEGSKVFAHFYEHREPAQLLRFKSGYLPLVGNLIGYAAVRLPTRLIPYGLVGSAILISAATYSLFFAPCFRRWMPSDRDRAVLCLILGLAPISDCLLVTMSDYSLWNLLAALLLLTVCPPSPRRGWRYLHALACNVLVWSHPLTIIIAPLVLWRAFKGRESQGFYRLLAFNLLVHQVFGVAGIVTTHGLWDHGTGVPIETSLLRKVFDSCRWTIQIIAATFFRTAFGEPLLERLAAEFPAILFMWTGFIVLASCSVARKIVRVRAVFLFLAYVIISVTFLSCFLRYEDVHNEPLGFISYSPRYIHVQSLSCLLLFGVLLSGGWQLVAERLQKASATASTRRLAIVPLIALLCYYYFLNVQLGYSFFGKTQPAGRYYDPDPRNGIIVRDFFSRLSEAERAQGSRKGIQLRATKFNDWPITIDTTVTQPLLSVRMSRRARVLAAMLALLAFGYITRRWSSRWFSSWLRQQDRLPSQ
jgi:hypothetical protein